MCILVSQRQLRSLRINKVMEFVRGQRMCMVPFASVVTTAFEEVVLQVTDAVFPTVRRRGSRGKKTGKKVPTLKLKYRSSQSNGALNYKTYCLYMNPKATILASSLRNPLLNTPKAFDTFFHIIRKVVPNDLLEFLLPYPNLQLALSTGLISCDIKSLT